MKEKESIELTPARGFGSLAEFVRPVARRFNIRPVSASLVSTYRSGKYEHGLKICFGRHAHVEVLACDVPGLLELKARKEKAEKLARECCTELEFLNKIRAPSRVGAFQAFAARMWSPKTKEISATLLKKLAEQFIQSKRDFSCKL